MYIKCNVEKVDWDESNRSRVSPVISQARVKGGPDAEQLEVDVARPQSLKTLIQILYQPQI